MTAQPILDFDAVPVVPGFDGATYERAFDEERLNAQARRVWWVVSDARWHTLSEISAATGDPEASVSARLRDLRKPEWGGLTVERRRRGDLTRGLFEYRVLVDRRGE